jgi:putative NADPH-quinone reductase
LSIPSGNCETILPNRNPAVEVHQPESKPMSESGILILFAHPAYQRSRGNRFLVEAVQQSDAFTFRDLYEHYPDFNIDVAEEQRLLLEHDVIVLQHPFYWYSCPALLKEWLDLVLEHGFAYGHDGEALRGKSMLSAITTGGSERATRARAWTTSPSGSCWLLFDRRLGSAAWITSLPSWFTACWIGRPTRRCGGSPRSTPPFFAA